MVSSAATAVENRIASHDLFWPAKYHWPDRASWLEATGGEGSQPEGQPVCQKLSARKLEPFDSLARRGRLGATSSTVALNSPDGFPTLALESGQHFVDTGKGPVDAALLEVVQSFRKGPVDNGLGREHNLAVISFSFQKVAH